MPRAKRTEGHKVVASKTTIQAPDFRSVYVNHVQFGFTRFDFQVAIGLVGISNAPGHKDAVLEQLSLKMTPAYAKAFVVDMANFVAQYERDYGPIQIPRPLDQPLPKTEEGEDYDPISGEEPGRVG